MINNKSLDKIHKLGWHEDWVFPDIQQYCFANIPEFVISLFANSASRISNDVLPVKDNKYKKVIFILIDAFGWNLFQRYKDKFPLLGRLASDGMVSKFTSQFPSTTSCEITSILTGLSVGESGVYEWRYFEPLLDEIIKPLECKIDKNDEPFSLDIVDPRLLFPKSKFFRTLETLGIDVYISNHRDYAKSLYNQTVCEGYNVASYRTSSEALINLFELSQTKENGFFYIYFGDIDSISHQYGPFSKHTEKELENLLNLIEMNIINNLDELGKDTLFILTADHGHAQVDPQKLLFINHLYPEIKNYLSKNKNKDLMVPAGSQRDFFLHIQDEFFDPVQANLEKKLEGKARVFKTEELIRKGIFGKVERRFRQRVANLVILSRGEYSVWWFDEERKGHYTTDLGRHGGLSRDEMEIPFITYS